MQKYFKTTHTVRKKCNTLKDCVHWLQGICAFRGVVVLVNHLSWS